MKAIKSHLELERKVRADDRWDVNMEFAPSVSVEQARQVRERAMINRPFEDTEYRLVYVRVETTREVVD